MKHCAFFLREKFTKTFFVSVFILLGFFLRTESAFAITEVDIVDIQNEQRTTFKAYKLTDNFYSIKNLPPQTFTAGKTTTGNTYKIGTVSNDQSQTRVSYNSNGTPNTSDDYVESIETWKDGKYYNFRNLKISQDAGITNGMLAPVPANERVYKNQQEASGVYNQNYTQKYSALLNQTQQDFNLQYNQGQTLSTNIDLNDSSSQFATDWKNNLYKLIDDPTLTTAEKEAIFNATKASYEGRATPEQNALLEIVSQQEENKNTIKKIQEGGKDKYVSNSYKSAVDIGESAEGVRAAQANREGGDDGTCFSLSITSLVRFDFVNCIEQGLYYLMYMLSLVLGFVGIIFNWVFEFTVIEMSDRIKNLSVINAAWEVFRDLANILFIFLLLYLSIQTILQTDGGEVKHTLSKLIIVALLLNFSLFFTKVIIDSSNILTISIYEKVKPSDGNLGLADAFMGVFQFQKLYSQQGMEKFNNTGNIDLGQAGRTFAEQQGGNAWATFIMGSIMIVIATFVFIAVIAIFIKRLVVLILLMVTAPLAFVASIFPKTSGMAEEIWWGNLIKNAFYAPLFMVFIWISLKILTVKDFIGTVKGSENAIVPIVVGFIVAIAFLLISLVAAESLHVAGAHTAMKWYTGMQSWAGKNSFGRAAYNMLEKNHPIGGALYEWSKSRNPIVNTFARMGKHGLHHAANANFDKVPGTGGGHGDHGHGDSHAQGGYAKKLKEDVKERQEFRGDQQKHDASLWLDDFIIDKKFIDRDADGKPKLKSNAGYSHDVKAMEQDYESMSLEDKSEYIKAAKYKADEFRDKWVTEGGAENLEKADAIEAVANHMRYSRTDAKEQEQLERKMESVSTIDKAQLHKIMSSVKTANSSYEQVKASKGEGAPETKKAFSNLNIVKERADKFFGGLTERKRAEVIAGQGTEKQKELLRNPHFEQLAKKHITTYSQIDAMTKGGTTDPEMKKLASNISYTAKGRFELLKDVEHKDHKGNKALQDKFKEDVKEFVTPKPGQKYEDMDISEVIAQYKNKQATDDETFFNADKNLSRTLPSNPAYVARKEEIEKIKNTKKTSSTNP